MLKWAKKMDAVSIQAYQNIAAFEILLRRLVRWQLMSLHGREWLVQIGTEHFDLIETRIRYEKRNGQYWNGSSELSFLTLNELISLIFDKLWSSSFRTVFKSDIGLKEALRKSIIPLRNKVAHFRTIDQFDLNTGIRYVPDMMGHLNSYYGSPDRVPLYVSSDLEASDDLIDPEIVNQINEELSLNGIDYFWDEFGKFESIRASSLGCGFGIFDSNLFIELDLSQKNTRINLTDWFYQHKYCVNSISFNDSKIRVFIPLKADKDTVKRTMNSLYKKIALDIRISLSDNFVESEYIINSKLGESVGLAF